MRRYFAEGEYDAAQGALIYAPDHLGSVRDVLAGSSGQSLGHFDYDPYGNATAATGSHANWPDMRYAGLFYHPTSGLYLATNRAYDPAIGRWLSRDPIEEEGGLNLYLYAGGNPIVFDDPLGLWDAQAGSGYLNDPHNGWTGGKSKKQCAPAVRQALNAAGLDTNGHPYPAGKYGPFLQQLGFLPVSLSGYTPQEGDVAVWQDPSGGSGHIEYYDGNNWHSDYIQQSPSTGDYATNQYGPGFSPNSKWTAVQIYRYPK